MDDTVTRVLAVRDIDAVCVRCGRHDRVEIRTESTLVDRCLCCGWDRPHIGHATSGTTSIFEAGGEIAPVGAAIGGARVVDHPGVVRPLLSPSAAQATLKP